MEELVFAILLVIGIVFVLPIAAWLSAQRSRARLRELEGLVQRLSGSIDLLAQELGALRHKLAAEERVLIRNVPAVAPREAAGPRTPAPESRRAEEPRTARPEVAPEVEKPAAVLPPVAEPPPVAVEPAAAERPIAEPAPEAEEPAAVPPPGVPAPVFAAEEARAPVEEPQVSYVPPADVPPASLFDWERLVGVKLFSAFSGITAVLAAVFFLSYSIQSGWLQPPVRVAIGIVVAIALLVTCELKAARRYAATANALDAAAIAILFSTFFAAHALWNLIPSVVAFVLLAVVTAVAVLLSIRRESLFIAVLGLLGGFAAPALLSTGENRPIPLFAYLLLLNVGLAWVAYRRRWPALTWLSLVLTTLYQWGWVFRFLDSASLPLAMTIFMVFPLAAVVALALGRPTSSSGARAFERGALVSAFVPVLFALYLAAVPEYAARPVLLLGFVLMIDAGLLAVALGRREELMHVAGAVGTVLTLAIWLGSTYQPGLAPYAAPVFTALFAGFYVVAPDVASRLRRPFVASAAESRYAAAVVLFAFAVVAVVEPAFAAHGWRLLGILLITLVLISWRAIASGSAVYHVAAFFAVAAQASWSSAHLSIDRLGTAVGIYSAFGLVALGVPVVARRLQRPLRPRWGAGVVLLASVSLLLFLSTGDLAPAAIWALALLLAILNAALFVESASGELPLISQAGSLLSWVVLFIWWSEAAASVGVIASLTVLTALSLATLVGHAWCTRVAAAGDALPGEVSFAAGPYLSLIGHGFLLFVALNPEWSRPPWPLFGALAVVTLATCAASLYARAAALHASGVVAAAVVVASWASAAPGDGVIALGAAAVLAAYSLSWIRVAPAARQAAGAAAAVLVAGQFTAIASVSAAGGIPFGVLLAAHAVFVAVVLWLTSRYHWPFVAPVAVAPSWIAVFQWQVRSQSPGHWAEVLAFGTVLYAIFVAYPILLGRRAVRNRDPYTAAVLASAMFFFSARAAFLEGDLRWMIGVVPVAAGAALTILLRQLLNLEADGDRDTGRLALIAGASLAFVTVAIPLQLRQHWITIGWALEGAALAWLYWRVRHGALLAAAVGLLAVVFVRLAMNPDVLQYEPRGAYRVVNWYLYTYAICAVAMLISGRWLSATDDSLGPSLPRASHLLPAAGVILLFLLLNIEIADFFATGPTVAFRFGVTLQQDLTYTIGWLAFGIGLLAAGIYLRTRAARIASVGLIAVTAFKCFLYDLGSLAGLYRVASLVGLALSLALVALALQKYALSKPRGVA